MLAALSRLPTGLLLRMDRLVFQLLYRVWRYRRNVVAENLRHCFPAWSSAQRREAERSFYRGAAQLAVEVLAARRIDPTDLQRRVSFLNPELLEESAGEGSALLLAGHQCNWEWLLLACCLRFQRPFDAVYKPLSVTSVDRYMEELRRRFGAEPVPKDDALMTIMRRRGDRRVFCMVSDQSPDPSKPRYWTDFLGRESSFPVGPQTLAHYTKYPVLFVGMRRTAPHHYEVWFEKLADPPHAKEGGDLIAKYVRSLEAMVRAQPEAWLWTNRKWKYPKPLLET